MDKYEEFQLKEKLKEYERKTQVHFDDLLNVRDHERKSIRKRVAISHNMIESAEIVGRLKYILAENAVERKAAYDLDKEEIRMIYCGSDCKWLKSCGKDEENRCAESYAFIEGFEKAIELL